MSTMPQYAETTIPSRQPLQDPPPHSDKPSHRGRALLVGGILLGYLLLVVLGATTSSLSYDLMREDPSQVSESTFGSPRGIRSDEFTVNTPLMLGLGASGSDSIENPLTAPSDVVSGIPTSGDLFSSVVYFDGSLMRLGNLLPVASLFAATWWLPFVVLLLALPAWLRRVGASPTLAWFATALVVLAPATAWWSNFPVRILAFTAAGSVLAMMATSSFAARRRLVGTAQAMLAGLLIARLATWYLPWSITLAAPVLLATLCWLLVDEERRRPGLISILVTAVVSLTLTAGIYWQNWSGVRASMATIYPGQRRSGGDSTPLAQLFGAPGDAYFQLGNDTTSLNVSELSSGFAFCAVWAVILFVAVPQSSAVSRARSAVGSGLNRLPRLSTDPETWVVGVLAAAMVIELVWATVSLGRVGAAIPVLDLVPPKRAAETVGFVAVLLVSLMLSRRGPVAGWRVPLVAAGASAAVTAYAVSDLQSFAPGIGAPLIVTASAAVFVVVLTMTRQPDRWRWTALAACLAGATVVAVNPLQIGVGDLRDSASARTMLAEGDAARENGTLWATDDPYTDSLLMATGVPILSGIQLTGPDRPAWHQLDATGAYETAWNRGGSSIEMSWRPTGDPVVSVGSADQILVAADPCDLAARGFALGHVLSRGPLDNSCLSPAGTLQWQGSTRYMYRVEQPGN